MPKDEQRYYGEGVLPAGGTSSGAAAEGANTVCMLLCRVPPAASTEPSLSTSDCGCTWLCRAMPCHAVPPGPLCATCLLGRIAAITSAAWRGPCTPLPCPVAPGGVMVPAGASDMLEVGQGWSWEHLAGLGAPRSSQTCPWAAGAWQG